jgi:hypothetical protein
MFQVPKSNEHMALARCLREPQATTDIVTTDFNPLVKIKKASQLLERLFVVPHDYSIFKN